VVKDTLARIAAREAGIEGLSELFTGPIGVAIGYDDPASRSSCVADLRSEVHADGRHVRGAGSSKQSEVANSTRPCHPVRKLLAMVAMVLASPMRSLAVVLNAKLQQLAWS